MNLTSHGALISRKEFPCPLAPSSNPAASSPSTRRADLEQGDVLVEDGRIAAVGANLAADHAEIIDATGMIVMPGLVNAHIHTWQTGLRGLAGDWAATNYFRAMHAGLATFFKPEDIHIANLVGALNQINSGTTTLVDWHHNNPTPAHSDAADRRLVGNAASAPCSCTARPSPTPSPARSPTARSRCRAPRSSASARAARQRRRARDDGARDPRTADVGARRLPDRFPLARELDLVASLHHSGPKMLGPDAYDAAAKAGLDRPKVNVVHGNALTDRDLDILFGDGATFCVTTEVEMQMAYGEPLSGRVRERGGWFGIGSDIESAYAADMFTVMRTTLQASAILPAMRHRAKTGEAPFPIPVTTRDALRWGTIDGARMMHLDKRIGSLTPGKAADVVLLRADDLNMQPPAVPCTRS